MRARVPVGTVGRFFRSAVALPLMQHERVSLLHTPMMTAIRTQLWQGQIEAPVKLQFLWNDTKSGRALMVASPLVRATYDLFCYGIRCLMDRVRHIFCL
jgi:hypothetical protein